MSLLQSLPNRFDDTTHDKLDGDVQKAVEDLGLSGIPDISSNLVLLGVLLNTIIANSEGDLNTKYLDINHARELFATHVELRGMLASAWKHKSYRDIRNLAILKAQQPPAGSESSSGVDPIIHQRLSGSFEAKYYGAAVDGFYEYLTHNEKLFKTAGTPKYYAKFCSIVQSSGTGKSRMLTELSKKDVIVIYMNLREKDDKLSFPARDQIPSRILTKFPDTHQEYEAICGAFFTALFDTLREYLSQASTTGDAKADIMRWTRQMCDMSDPPRFTTRADFFRKFSERYTQVHTDIVNAIGRRSSETAASVETSSTVDVDKATSESTGSDVDEAADGIKKLSISDSETLSSLIAPAVSAYKNIAPYLRKVFGQDSDEPKLVIAIDEAHPLTVYQANYRPADILCRVVNAYSHRENHAVWVVFASTTSRVADFAPPNKKYNSTRVAVKGQKLFSPYTQLGWDQSAVGLGDINIEAVSQVDHIAGYGRPLWISLKAAFKDTGDMLDTASEKLCGGYGFDPAKLNHVLAVLGQRFALNVTFGHPDSVEHLENGVASHLRVCLATTLDRNWRFTRYPSEPLLSCVAAKILHEERGGLTSALGTLLSTINSGMIDMGERGELASRLLWLLAKDLFIRTQAKNVVTKTPSEWKEHLVDCQMIPVVEWLEFIFGPQIWDEKYSQGSLAREAFENAYVNFSHWICMDAYISGSKACNELPLDEWTMRHWQRTSAAQCCHQQPLIDKVIPMYFKDGPENASVQSRMSQIFISDKARRSTDSKDALHSITRRHKNIGGENMRTASDSKPLPYIAILADLGQPPSFSLTFPGREVEDRCLRIYAAGVDSATYPFLAQYPVLMECLQNLVQIQQIPETELPFTEYLNAQVQFGSTATASHMEWEQWKLVPDARTKLTWQS